MSKEEFKPNPNTACLYKEQGGVNWFLCRIISYYSGKVWLHNLSVGSMPVKNENAVRFMPLDQETAKLLSNKS